jgi:hypothetical protein
MSSGPWLTLLFCEIYYLSAVNYDPTTSDLFLIRVSIYPLTVGGGGGGGLQPLSKSIYFVRVIMYPVALPYKIIRGH